MAIQDLISPGTMIAASIIMGRALAPVEMAVSQWKNFVSARDTYSRINELLDAQPEEVEEMELPPPGGNVEVNGVFIQPPGSDNIIINNLSVSFVSGTATAIIGPSGSGKSTLVHIVRVWPTLGNHVRYDGASIGNWHSEKLGPYVGICPKTLNYLMAQWLKIFLGSDMDSEAVVSAAKRAGVHDLILQLSDGYDTNIGLNGQSLSEVSDSIALARAMYKTPKIIILDEPNSNLDAAGEKALAEAIKLLRILALRLFLSAIGLTASNSG